MTRRFSFFPETATADARVLVMSRAVRAFGDGFVSVLLAALSEGTRLPIVAGRRDHDDDTGRLGGVDDGARALAWRWPRQRLLLGAALLMALTGLRLYLCARLLAAAAGRLRRDAQSVVRRCQRLSAAGASLLPQTVADSERTALFARYGFVGTLSAACGALSAGVPGIVAERTALTLKQALMGMFVLYTLLALAAMLLYRRALASDRTGRGTAGCAVDRVERRCLPAGGPLQHRLVRRRLRGAVAARALAVPSASASRWPPSGAIFFSTGSSRRSRTSSPCRRTAHRARSTRWCSRTCRPTCS